MPLIGYLNGASRDAFAPYIAAFHQGLKDGGFVEGQNLVIDHRSADDQPERLPALAADLVHHKVAVLVTRRVKVLLAGLVALLGLINSQCARELLTILRSIAGELPRLAKSSAELRQPAEWYRQQHHSNARATMKPKAEDFIRFYRDAVIAGHDDPAAETMRRFNLSHDLIVRVLNEAISGCEGQDIPPLRRKGAEAYLTQVTPHD